MADQKWVPICDERRIDAIFAELDQDLLPGAAVGIAIGGKPVYRKGFGLANMELPIRLTPSMRMRIGSTSKHFTSLAYMLLCEDGRAAVDDPIGKYLPELHPVVHPITMRQLMGHLGGLRDAVEIGRQFSGTGRPVSVTELLSLYRDLDDVDASPGQAWNYNNGGYLVLAVIIERITGQPLEEVLRRRIFEPAGLKDSLLRRFDTDFVPNSATLHTSRPGGGFEKSYFGAASAGYGGLVSTVDDMLRWLAHMSAPVVGAAATWQLMKQPQVLTNGTCTGYGLGLITDRYRGIETLSHAGGVMGGNSQMLKVPAAGLDVAVMVNRHDVSAMILTNKILDACLPGLAAKEEPTPFEPVVGVFRSPTTGRVIQMSARDGQQIAAIGGFDWQLVPDADRVLRPLPVWGYIRLSVTLEGDLARPGTIGFSDFGNLDVLRRLPPLSRQMDASDIEGRYRSDTTGTAAIISSTSHGARLQTLGRFGSASYELECLAEGIWRARSAGAVQWWGGIMSFDGSDGGFRFSSGRISALSFRRLGASAGPLRHGFAS